MEVGVQMIYMIIAFVIIFAPVIYVLSIMFDWKDISKAIWKYGKIIWICHVWKSHKWTSAAMEGKKPNQMQMADWPGMCDYAKMYCKRCDFEYEGNWKP